MRKSGFTLMEIVVALCLLTIIVVGFLPVFISANALNTNFERNYDAQVVMGIYMKERVQNSVLLKENHQYKSYVDDAGNLKQYAESLELQATLANQELYLEKIGEVNDVLKQKGKLSSHILDAIDQSKPSTVTIDSITMNQGVVVVSVSSTTQLGPSLFARNLGIDPTFLAIDYPGYTRIDALYEDIEEVETLIAPESYIATIYITLKGGY